MNLRDDLRRFGRAAKRALLDVADGRCELCGVELGSGWHADHKHPWSLGGATDVVNGQALCAACNLAKGAKMSGRGLLGWQQEALAKYLELGQRNFTLVATPGAGKTFMALLIAQDLLRRGLIDLVCVVVPSAYLTRQWMKAAKRDFGLELDPDWTGGKLRAGFIGGVLTYQAVCSGMSDRNSTQNALREQCSRFRVLVILDEVHHSADRDDDTNKAWGTGLLNAFDRAALRLITSGTLFRTDGYAIPFVRYEPVPGTSTLRSVADYNYSYERAVREGVCRPLSFPHYECEAQFALRTDDEWREINQSFADVEAGSDRERYVLNTVLDTSSNWLRTVLREAHADLMHRREVTPTAGGLVVCRNRNHARAVVTLFKDELGIIPKLAISSGDDDDADIDNDVAAKDIIEKFAPDKCVDPWLVSVRMVSEGVNIPRLMVGVFATNVFTELYARQFWARCVRTSVGENVIASIYIPSAPSLVAHAMRIMEERDHALAEDDPPRRKKDPGGEGRHDARMQPLGAEAMPGGEVYAGESFELDELYRAQIFKNELKLGPNVTTGAVAAALRRAGAPNVYPGAPEAPPSAESPLAIRLERERAKANQKAKQFAVRLTKLMNRPMHQEVNVWLRDETGTWIGEASEKQIARRIELLNAALRGDHPWAKVNMK